MTLFVATSNPGKLRDFAIAASGAVEQAIAITPLPGLAAIPAPPEEEPTFLGNATSKAVFYSRFAPGEIVLADDSGLAVDALEGAPGVRSARYADDCSFMLGVDLPLDTRNNLCLVAALQNTPQGDRQARYHCVLVAARDGEVIATGSGSVAGSILTEPRGTGGFGYDPYFLPAEAAHTMAELDSATRMTLSHRGRALKDLLRTFTALHAQAVQA
jgi:XTP/dITP diphosphohydrolase